MIQHQTPNVLDTGFDFVLFLAILGIINKEIKIKNKEVDFVQTNLLQL
jgi:hypothetical protein